MTIKEHLHELVEEPPEYQAAAAARYLEYLRDQAANLPRSLRDAPIDDEPETDEERAGLEEARADLAAGRVVGNEEVRREFGW